MKSTYVQPSEAEYMARSLIDSEYENVQGFTCDDLWDYLSGFEPCTKAELTRLDSDNVFRMFAGNNKTI